MKRIKSRAELLAESYLTKTEISRLLKVPYTVADTLYGRARDADERIGIDYYPTKISMKSLLKVAQLDYSLLAKQIKNADAATSAQLMPTSKASSIIPQRG